MHLVFVRDSAGNRLAGRSLKSEDFISFVCRLNLCLIRSLRPWLLIHARPGEVSTRCKALHGADITGPGIFSYIVDRHAKLCPDRILSWRRHSCEFHLPLPNPSRFSHPDSSRRSDATIPHPLDEQTTLQRAVTFFRRDLARMETSRR